MKELDLVALANDGQHFAEKVGNTVRIIDSLTGKVVAVQNTYATLGLDSRDNFTECVLVDGSKVLVQKGLENVVLDPKFNIELRPYMIDVICQKIAEGGSLSRICKEEGMPSYNMLCRWKRQHEWVNKALAEARIDRAENLRDQALDTAAKAVAEDPVDAAKLQVDTLKWAAGVDDTRFSPRAKVEATVNLPMQIVVQTGIERGPVDIKPPTPQTFREVVSNEGGVTAKDFSPADSSGAGGDKPSAD